MRSGVQAPVPNIFNMGFGEFASRQTSMLPYLVASGLIIASGSAGDLLKCTSHPLRVGDLIRFSSGTVLYREFLVLEVTDANTFRVNYNFLASQLPAASDTFSQLRLISPLVDSSGYLQTTTGGMSVVDKSRLDYTGTSVTTAAYVQIKASLAAVTKKLQIFDSSGQTLILAVGGAGSEVDKLYVIPGGNGEIDHSIAAGSRISLKAVSATAGVGESTINYLG